jgi:hypothetical protein
MACMVVHLTLRLLLSDNRTLTLTTTLNKKNVAARAAALAANRTCNFELTLYGTIVQLIKKMPDVGGLMKRMFVRFSHSDPEYGSDEIVGGFGGARRAFGPLRQSVG